MTRTLLAVHGAWSAAWAWRKVRPLLRERAQCRGSRAMGRGDDGQGLDRRMVMMRRMAMARHMAQMGRDGARFDRGAAPQFRGRIPMRRSREI